MTKMTYRKMYSEGVNALKLSGILEPEIDARLLLEYVCKTDRNTLLAHPERELSDLEITQYEALVKKRCEHIPLQHLTGVQEFMGIEFKVDNRVLIPRQDTEILVEEALTYVEDGMRVLDMCTGSGCIILSLMNYRNIEGVACDFSEDALLVAKENALNLNLSPTFLQGDMFDALADTPSDAGSFEGYFDVLVSNPPYIKKDVIPTLMSEVRDHDPMMALDGGKDGLDFYRCIAEKSPFYLTNYGRVFLEIGYDQGDDVKEILEKSGFKDVKVINDYANNPRVVIGKYIK